ncbi:MAG: DUF47 family protein [Planctomycetota bacterium]
MFKKLLPREDRFFALLEQQAEAIQHGLDRFHFLLRNYDKRLQISREIKELESKADDVAHAIFQLLSNSFVTPFDREDIQRLTDHMDDVLDHVEATSARMEIYDLPEPTEEVHEMSRVLQEAFSKVTSAVGKLRSWKNRDEILKICVEVNSLENEGDSLLRRALHGLFKDATDPLHVIKMKEIYENLEDAIDHCEDLANVIETIMIKNA